MVTRSRVESKRLPIEHSQAELAQWKYGTKHLTTHSHYKLLINGDWLNEASNEYLLTRTIDFLPSIYSNLAVTALKFHQRVRLSNYNVSAASYPLNQEPKAHVRIGTHHSTWWLVIFQIININFLSQTNIATRQCHWYNNRFTRDSLFPVLSY